MSFQTEYAPAELYHKVTAQKSVFIRGCLGIGMIHHVYIFYVKKVPKTSIRPCSLHDTKICWILLNTNKSYVNAGFFRDQLKIPGLILFVYYSYFDLANSLSLIYCLNVLCSTGVLFFGRIARIY